MSAGQLTAVLIVAIVMFASVMKAKYAHYDRQGRQRNSGASSGLGDGPEAVRLREEVKQLKERLAVLERITIEKENSLEREIERLRDR
jgi:uncharacterized protein YlxW (UPF0749 family)